MSQHVKYRVEEIVLSDLVRPMKRTASLIVKSPELLPHAKGESLWHSVKHIRLFCLLLSRSFSYRDMQAKVNWSVQDPHMRGLMVKQGI